MSTISPRIFSIEGNIGSGKTTLFNILRQQMENERIRFVEEPVKIWESFTSSEDNENILQKFYKNKERYSFSFQIMVYFTFMNEIQKCIHDNPQCEIIICERSIDSGKQIFSQMAKEDNYIDDIQMQIYQLAVQNCPFQLSGVVYVDIPPEICWERIAMRGRKGEETIPLDYLKQCDKYHKQWLLEDGDGHHPPFPILHLQKNNIVLNDPFQCISLIRDFIS